MFRARYIALVDDRSSEAANLPDQSQIAMSSPIAYACPPADERDSLLQGTGR
jgi:hypothetical protein